MRTTGQRGFGLIEMLVVLVIVGVVMGFVLKQYMSSTVRSVEQMQEQKPMGLGRIAADQTSLSVVRTTIQLYRAQHGQLPPDKATVVGLLAAPPRFQCPGNDFTYDPTDGSVRLVIEDAARC